MEKKAYTQVFFCIWNTIPYGYSKTISVLNSIIRRLLACKEIKFIRTNLLLLSK